MEIELYYADQLVPTAELFRALQTGTLDAVQSDEATMASPVDIAVFGGYFPFATRYSLDVPALFHYYGLKEIWEEAYAEVENVTWLSTGAWDPLHIFTVDKPIRSLADMNGLRVFGVPTAGKFLSKYGLVPVTIPWDNVEVAMQTGELDGVAWCGFTEAYEVGWADVCKYALGNSVTGAWFGSYFANTRELEEGAAAPAGAVPRHHRPVALLPRHLVLGRRSQAARRRREDGADAAAARGMGSGRQGCRRLLGRGRRLQPARRQGRRDLQEVCGEHGQGGVSVPAKDVKPTGGHARPIGHGHIGADLGPVDEGFLNEHAVDLCRHLALVAGATTVLAGHASTIDAEALEFHRDAELDPRLGFWSNLVDARSN